jgi:hypothetical protein
MTAVQEINGIWHVSLSPNHPVYQSVGLVPRYDDDRHCVVIVDVAKLIHYWSLDHRGYQISPVECWSQAKKDGVFEFLSPPKPRETYVEMPIAFLNEIPVEEVETRFWFFKRRIERLSRYVGFTNGRHRTRYLAHAGATQIPVQTSLRNAPMLKHFCGLDD